MKKVNSVIVSYAHSEFKKFSQAPFLQKALKTSSAIVLASALFLFLIHLSGLAVATLVIGFILDKIWGFQVFNRNFS